MKVTFDHHHNHRVDMTLVIAQALALTNQSKHRSLLYLWWTVHSPEINNFSVLPVTSLLYMNVYVNDIIQGYQEYKYIPLNFIKGPRQKNENLCRRGDSYAYNVQSKDNIFRLKNVALRLGF